MEGGPRRRAASADDGGALAGGVHKKEHEQILPRPGWVEHDAVEIWTNVQEVVAGAVEKAGVTRAGIRALGITNQRRTTVLRDRNTGEPDVAGLKERADAGDALFGATHALPLPSPRSPGRRRVLPGPARGSDGGTPRARGCRHPACRP